MTAPVAAVPVAAPPPPIPVPLATPAPSQAGIAGLLPSIFTGLHPDDALGQMLFAIQKSGENNMAMTETRIQAARQAVRQQLDKFLDQLRQSLEAAKKAKEDDDGG